MNTAEEFCVVTIAGIIVVYATIVFPPLGRNSRCPALDTRFIWLCAQISIRQPEDRKAVTYEQGKLYLHPGSLHYHFHQVSHQHCTP